MDWPQMIDALRERGWTQSLLADKLQISQAAISDLRRRHTSDPKHSTGEAIKALYESEEWAPRLAPEPAAAAEAGNV